MAYYRLYTLDSRGKVRTVEEVDGADDRSVIEQVRDGVRGGSMELWSLSRFVMRFDADPRMPPSSSQALDPTLSVGPPIGRRP